MNRIAYMPVSICRGLLLLMLVYQPALSADYPVNISEAYLRTQFTFGSQDTLKYADCEKKTYPTCTYVWGAESKKDATRKKYGLVPDGNKIMIIYAQAKNAESFQRVLATYSDSEKIVGLGKEAVWSAKRNQLSLLTEENLIIHINIDEKDRITSKEAAVSIAEHLLEQL